MPAPSPSCRLSPSSHPEHQISCPALLYAWGAHRGHRRDLGHARAPNDPNLALDLFLWPVVRLACHRPSSGASRPQSRGRRPVDQNARGSDHLSPGHPSLCGRDHPSHGEDSHLLHDDCHHDRHSSEVGLYPPYRGLDEWRMAPGGNETSHVDVIGLARDLFARCLTTIISITFSAYKRLLTIIASVSGSV